MAAGKGIRVPKLIGVCGDFSKPGSQLAISDKDLAAILTYVRQAWGNKAPAVTAEQIAQIKAETKGRAVQWTAAELNAVPVKK